MPVLHYCSPQSHPGENEVWLATWAPVLASCDEPMEHISLVNVPLQEKLSRVMWLSQLLPCLEGVEFSSQLCGGQSWKCCPDGLKQM